MELLFLGTGAADWDINAFKKSTEFRRNSSALLDGQMLIDPGPHVFHFAESNGMPNLFGNLKNIIVTHTHGDHFCPETVAKLCLDRDVTLWGDFACRRKLERALGKETASKIKFSETRINYTYNIGGYSVTPLRSNHATDDPEETTRLYLIENEGKILYYGCDSSWIPTTAWNVIQTKPVNVMVLELTCGETAPDDWRIFEHNTLDMLELMLRMFRKYKYFGGKAKFYVSHIARTLHTDHDALIKRLEPLGVTPVFDGMKLDI